MRALAGWLVVAAGALLGCSGAPPVRIDRTGELEYPAKRSPYEVALLREAPSVPTDEIAILSSEGAYHQTTEEVLALLREHASLLGADALVVLRETYRPDSVLRAGRSRAELYGLPGPPSAIPDGPDPGLLRRPWVEARAVHYAPR